MRKYSMWLVGMGLITATLTVGSMVTTASAATAQLGHLSAPRVPAVWHSPFCNSDDDGDCVVTAVGTAWPSNGLNIRSGPGTGYSIVGVMPYHGTGTVDCFSTGTNINGDIDWDYIETVWGTGYVSDYYLSLSNGGLDPC